MTDPALREVSVEFAKTIADELQRQDQEYFKLRYTGLGVQIIVRLAGRDMIERYVRRAIEADWKARACPAAE
jgi:hypothetical protein